MPVESSDLSQFSSCSPLREEKGFLFSHGDIATRQQKKNKETRLYPVERTAKKEASTKEAIHVFPRGSEQPEESSPPGVFSAQLPLLLAETSNLLLDVVHLFASTHARSQAPADQSKRAKIRKARHAIVRRTELWLLFVAPHALQS